MAGRRLGELLCGIGALAWGLLLLLLAYLQPYLESNATAMNVLKLHPGFTAIETPHIVAAGLPILGVTLGAITDSLTPPGARGFCCGLRPAYWASRCCLGLSA